MSVCLSMLTALKFLSHEGGCGGTKQDAPNLVRSFSRVYNSPECGRSDRIEPGLPECPIIHFERRNKKGVPVIWQANCIFWNSRQWVKKAIWLPPALKNFCWTSPGWPVQEGACPLSKLCIGLECGGSDGFSGISATRQSVMHPTSWLLWAVQFILSEFPELCGVEQELSDRCADEANQPEIYWPNGCLSAESRAVGFPALIWKSFSR